MKSSTFILLSTLWFSACGGEPTDALDAVPTDAGDSQRVLDIAWDCEIGDLCTPPEGWPLEANTQLIVSDLGDEIAFTLSCEVPSDCFPFEATAPKDTFFWFANVGVWEFYDGDRQPKEFLLFQLSEDCFMGRLEVTGGQFDESYASFQTAGCYEGRPPFKTWDILWLCLDGCAEEFPLAQGATMSLADAGDVYVDLILSRGGSMINWDSSFQYTTLEADGRAHWVEIFVVNDDCVAGLAHVRPFAQTLLAATYAFKTTTCGPIIF